MMNKPPTRFRLNWRHALGSAGLLIPLLVHATTPTALLAQYRELATKPGLVAMHADMAPLAGAAHKISAEFVFPYLAHAPMEPLNCTIQLDGDKAELWMGTQMPGLDAMAAAKTLGLPPQNIKVHTQMAGGGFGRRAIPSSDYVVEACGVAKAVRTAGISAPVGQACTHSPQATQLELPTGSSWSNTIFACGPRIDRPSTSLSRMYSCRVSLQI